MGLMSRRKGRRGEQQLVLHLASKFYKAERILNQAHTAGLPDVKAVKGDTTLTFELKTYREAFKTIYKLYYANKTEGMVFGCLLQEQGLRCVISTSLEELLNPDNVFFAAPRPSEKRVYAKLAGMNVKRGKADFLVVKDNGKPFLFLRYWSS